MIFENDDPHVPPNIKMKCEQAEKRRTIPIYIVQFFDTSNSWSVVVFILIRASRSHSGDVCYRQWLALDRLRELGEDLSKLSPVHLSVASRTDQRFPDRF